MKQIFQSAKWGRRQEAFSGVENEDETDRKPARAWAHVACLQGEKAQSWLWSEGCWLDATRFWSNEHWHESHLRFGVLMGSPRVAPSWGQKVISTPGTRGREFQGAQTPLPMAKLTQSKVTREHVPAGKDEKGWRKLIFTEDILGQVLCWTQLTNRLYTVDWPCVGK